MKKTFTIILFLFFGLLLLACSKENKIKSESKEETKQTAVKKDPRKIKTQICYDITNPKKEILLTKTEFDNNGKELKIVGFDENGKEIETIKSIYDEKGLKIRKDAKESDYEGGFREYTVTYKYDDKGRLLSEKYAGDYATDVSPDYFEYVYSDSDKPVEKLHYVTVMPENPKDLQYRETIKYDEKGNKIEEVTKGTKFDYLEKITYKYDENNMLIESTNDYDGSISKYKYTYEYY